MQLDTTTRRILNVLSSDLGRQFSINNLTQKIKETYGTAYYANIYNRLHDLEKQQFITLNQIGKSSIITLNFQNYLLTDLIAELETSKKIEAIIGKASLQRLVEKMDRDFGNQPSIKSICAIDLERNIKLNRLELLFLLRNTDTDHAHQEETWSIYTKLHSIESQYNLKIDSLTLNEAEFKQFLESDEANPVKEMMYRKTVLLSPQAFWNTVREIIEKGTKIRTDENELNPTDITETDLTYNLARFGYEEFGSTTKTGHKICIEDIATALLMQRNIRRTEAIPIILAKSDANSNLLTFLSKKYEVAGRLLGLLKILVQTRPREHAEQAIRFLEASGAKEVMADKNSILQRMTLYGARQE
jgi:hypothetical protein